MFCFARTRHSGEIRPIWTDMADSTRRPCIRLPISSPARWVGVVGLAVLVAATPAIAQSWWPFGGGDEEEEDRGPPVPREPVYRQPQPQQAPAPGQQPPPVSGNWSTNNPICLQLEQRLVQESQRGGQAQQQLPTLENDIRAADRTYQQAQAELERRDCYEYFLFSKSLRRTRQCVDLSNQMEGARRRLADLEARRQQITTSSSGRSNQDEIIRELARNDCGANYTQEARRREGRSSAFWEDEESAGSHGSWGSYGNQSFATYRTLCVRLCDGYYFPVSFSTLPNHFQQDNDVCQSKCAAPVELYYHQNPGAGVEQMVSMKTQQPYTSLKSAFRYRKEYVRGCSCKQAEYVPDPAAGPANKRAESPPDNKRAESLPWSGTVNPQ